MSVEITVTLIVIATDPKNRQNSSFLIESQNGFVCLPRKSLASNKTSRSVAEEMLEEYTGVSPYWAVLLPLGLFDNPEKIQEGIRQVDVAYATYIPEKTRQRKPDMTWLTFSELTKLNNENKFSSDDLQMVTSAIWRPI